MTTLTKVTRNFQITIPEEVRDELGIRLGDYIAMEREDFGFRFHKIENQKIEDFAGVLGDFKDKPSTELQKKWRREFAKRATDK